MIIERKIMSENMLQLTDDNFETKVINSNVPVLVDFWAVWCGPCKMIAPELEKLAEEKSSDVLKIGKLNVDENRDVAIKYGISSIPTLLLFKDGDVAKKLVGAMGKDRILDEIGEFI
jgi:thioredoxin 1